MNEEIVNQIALSLTPGIGGVLARQLVSYCGSAREVFLAPRRKLVKIPGIGEKTADAVLAKTAFSVADFVYEQAVQKGVEILFYTHPKYPARLRSLPDSPVLLYHHGNTDLNAAKTVAIVGTRNATAYGKKVTEEIVTALTRYQNVLVVSGLAYGIDIAAHKAAVKCGLPTVGVLGSGIDVIYPAAHKNTAQQMLENGGLLSEYPFGIAPDAPHFPARNRIVAGLADVTIVVEAALKGGALITARIANDYNRDVMAVPGNLEQSHSEGCNRLIRNHQAHIYTGPEDFEYLMGWAEENSPKKKQQARDWQHLPELSEAERNVLNLLQSRPDMLIDELSWQAQVPVNQLASVLLTLELQGLVKALPGKKFALVP
ncbi:MAG: DNA-processing protein DprA [Cytophagales bacterium]|nr:DNA-processing protein DprA [Cytophagales bacterium]